MISFFFIFLPLFFSERTPVRSGQPCRGSFTRRVAAGNACAGPLLSLRHWVSLGIVPPRSSVGGGIPCIVNICSSAIYTVYIIFTNLCILFHMKSIKELHIVCVYLHKSLEYGGFCAYMSELFCFSLQYWRYR